MGAIAKWMAGDEGSNHAQSTGSSKQAEPETHSDSSSVGSDPNLKPPPSDPMPMPTPLPIAQPKSALKTPGTTPPTHRKQVLLLIPPDFAYSELTSVSESFKSHEVTVMTAGAEKKLLEGYRHIKGERVFAGFNMPENTLKDVTAAFLDPVDAVIVMPGDVRTFTHSTLAGQDFKKVVDKAIQKKKVIGAIGSGIIVLGTHGFLEHAEASTVQARTLTLLPFKVKAWKDDPKVVVDLPFVTLGEFGHTKDFVEGIIKAINEVRTSPKR
jgi:putative intracellular protease/amidase